MFLKSLTLSHFLSFGLEPAAQGRSELLPRILSSRGRFQIVGERIAAQPQDDSPTVVVTRPAQGWSFRVGSARCHPVRVAAVERPADAAHGSRHPRAL